MTSIFHYDVAHWCRNDDSIGKVVIVVFNVDFIWRPLTVLQQTLCEVFYSNIFLQNFEWFIEQKMTQRIHAWTI